MTTEQLRELPVKELAAKNSLLLLWMTLPMLEEQLTVLRSWGFKPSTALFVWIKQNPKALTPFYGPGFYTASNVEMLYIGRKGKGFKPAKKMSQLIFAPRSRHSAKPTIVKDKIDLMYPAKSKIELFARERQPGWTATGLDYDGLDVREAITKYALMAAIAEAA